MSELDPPPSEIVDALSDVVEARSGLRFVGGRRQELATKAARVFASSGCASWSQYLIRLSDPGSLAALDELLEALVVGETYFFRHRAYFDELERYVLPELIDRRRDTRQLRLWCPGCATGEDAYSLAILVRRLIPDPGHWNLSILATDLSRVFLARAEAGVYGDWSFRETDDSFRESHFTREGRLYRVRSELRQLVRFARLNLAEEVYPSPASGSVDLVFCRNVLMYLAPETARRVLARLRAALVPGGWLILGPSDALPGFVTGFEVHAARDAVLYRRVDGEHHAAPASISSQPPLPQSRVAECAARTECQPASAVCIPASMSSRAAAPPGPLDRSDQTATGSPAEWDDLWRAARASANRGRFEEAAAGCRQIIARAKFRPEPYYLLGALHEMAGDDLAAAAAFRQALYVDRGFAPAHLALAAVQRRAGRAEEARRALARAEGALVGRDADELILREDGLTVGRLRDALAQARGIDRQMRAS